MAELVYKVFVVVDREFGERLTELPVGTPVWIVNTPTNRMAAERFFRERPTDNHLTGVTTFNLSEGCSPEESLLNELDVIDLHHGVHSARPPYTVLEIIGTPLTERIEVELALYGFNDFQQTSKGFRATRPRPSD